MHPVETEPVRNRPVKEAVAAFLASRRAALVLGCSLGLIAVAVAAAPAAANPPAAVLSTVACPTPPASPAFGGPVCHRVQRGEWLWKIARAAVPNTNPEVCALSDPHQVRLRVAALYRMNRATIGPNPNRLRPGMVIVVGGFSDAAILNAPRCTG